MSFLIFFCCVNNSRETNVETTNKLEMPKKLRVCYQNLGLGDAVSRKYHDVLNILSTRDPHVLYVSETLIDLETVARLEAKGFIRAHMVRH